MASAPGPFRSADLAQSPRFALACQPRMAFGDGKPWLRSWPNFPIARFWQSRGGDDEGIRLSLSGSQDKLPVLWMDDRVGITRGRPPSTHIVKVPRCSSVDDMVANEAYCMALAVGCRPRPPPR